MRLYMDINRKIQKAEIILNANNHNKLAVKRSTKLQTHQRFTVDYLKNHKDQRGLLIAHQMGTGKTLLGVAVADAFYGRPVLIVGPAHLGYVWEGEMTKYNLANSNKTRFTFIPYTDHATLRNLPDLASHVVILDEAHHIVSLVSGMEGGATLFKKLQGCFKILLLSGTPIYNDEYDLPYLINLCSGSMTLPMNRAEFVRKFTKVNWPASAFEGYWRPLISKLQAISSNGDAQYTRHA